MSLLLQIGLPLAGVAVGALLSRLGSAKKRPEANDARCGSRLSRTHLELHAIRQTDSEVGRLRTRVHDLEQRAHQQMDFFVNFPDVVKSLTAALSVGQVTASCSRGLSALLSTHKLGILLCHGDRQLRLVDGAGFNPSLRGKDLSLAPLDSLVRQRTVAPVPDYPGAAAALANLGLEAEFAIPIWHGDRLFGLIALAGAAGDPLVTRRTMAMVADLTGVALHAASTVTAIRREADNDQLTGLANRRSLMRYVQAELERCRSYNAPLSLAMMDVDNFKHFNDANGHQAGDKVLRAVARLAQSTTRRTDLVARYGGEEFTVVISAETDQALRHADRIRQTIADANLPHAKQQPLGCVSISVGVATFPTHAASASMLFEAADRALYQAKEQGRNRVVKYSGPLLSDSTFVSVSKSSSAA